MKKTKKLKRISSVRIINYTSPSRSTINITKKSTFLFISAQVSPFRVKVHFNDNEADGAITSMAHLQEQDLAPGGIVGFQLTYWQVAC